MTDQTPADLADKVRKLAARFRQQMEPHVSVAECVVWERAAEAVDALLPPPPLPTLADIPPEERAACRWMQCDVADHDTRYVIANPHDRHGEVALIAANGKIEWILPEYVTPRPDLPRLEWPGDTPAGPDHPAVGTVIESADDPRLAALPLGSILLDRDGDTTVKRRRAWTGDGYVPNEPEGDKFGRWKGLHIPKEEA